MEINKSFKQIQNRRIVLDVVNHNSSFALDLRDVTTAVFYFGDSPFVLKDIVIKSGDREEDCTEILFMGQTFTVLQTIEYINEFLFGEYEDGQA